MIASSGGAFVAGGFAAALGSGHQPPAVWKGVSFDSARGLDLMTPPPSEKNPGGLEVEGLSEPKCAKPADSKDGGSKALKDSQDPDSQALKDGQDPGSQALKDSHDPGSEALKESLPTTPTKVPFDSPGSNKRYLRRGKHLGRSKSMTSSTPSTSSKFDKYYHKILSFPIWHQHTGSC